MVRSRTDYGRIRRGLGAAHHLSLSYRDTSAREALPFLFGVEMTDAEMIAELRARGLTCAQIARHLQVSPVTVRRWARGEWTQRYQQRKALEGLYNSVRAEMSVDNKKEEVQNVRHEIPINEQSR